MAASSIPPTRSATVFLATKRGVGRGLALMGLGAVASSAALAWSRYQAQQADQKLPAEFVLEMDLERLKVVEKVDTSPLAMLKGESGTQVCNLLSTASFFSTMPEELPAYLITPLITVGAPPIGPCAGARLW